MQPTSIAAIYFLFWVLTALAMLPFGYEDVPRGDPDYVAGQAESAPRHFRPGRVVVRTTVVASVLFALFYVNYVNGWITAADLDISRLVEQPGS